MAAKLTRRRLALAALPLMQAPATAQEPPQDDPSRADPSRADMEAQRQNLRRNREAMAKVALPMHIEPAVTFKP